MGGRKPIGVDVVAASDADVGTFELAQESLSTMRVPLLYRSGDADCYLYVASFDGSGQDLSRDKETPTNVGAIHRQIEELMKRGEQRVAGGYVSGPGTQRNPVVRLADNALAFSYDERIISAYRDVARQAKVWLAENPNAEINIVSIGYSRGATLIPGFARLVERHGVLDPAGLSFHKDANGELVATSPRPPLVPPGHIAQAVALFDPVSTSLPKGYDLRLPSSVISGYSLLARDERRILFPHTAMLDDGVTPDGRFGRSTVAGAHSDVGGGNRVAGLEIRSGNVVVQYVNTLMDPPLLRERPVPRDPAQNVIHRSEQGMLGAYAIGAAEPGRRYVREQLCIVVDPCTDAMPRDDALAARFEYRHPVGPQPDATERIDAVLLDSPAHPDHALFRQAQAGVHALDAGVGRTPDAGSDRLAAALVVASRRSGLDSIDGVVIGDDGRRVFAVEGAPHDPAQRRAFVDTVPALAQPLAESTRQMERLRDRAVDQPVPGLAQVLTQPSQQLQLAPAF
jgi:hypothetical protein